MSSDYDAFDAILHHIFKQTQGEAWFKPSEESVQVRLTLCGLLSLTPFCSRPALRCV